MYQCISLALLLVALLLAYKCANNLHEGYQAMTEYNPTIMGVPIQNKRSIFKKSAAESGMFLPGMSLQLGLEKDVKLSGQTAYEANIATIADSLELEQTQDTLRHHLAATMTNYVPPEGIPVNQGLWVERNYLKNLHQPGLQPYPTTHFDMQESGF